MRPRATSESDAASLLERMLRCFATGDVDRVDQIVSDQYYDHQSSERESPHGPELFREVVAGARRSLPELTLHVDSVAKIDPDIAESRTRWHWTDEVGARRERTTIDRIRVANGKVVEHWGRQVD